MSQIMRQLGGFESEVSVPLMMKLLAGRPVGGEYLNFGRDRPDAFAIKALLHFP
jgi:hypothetical protein